MALNFMTTTLPATESWYRLAGGDGVFLFGTNRDEVYRTTDFLNYTKVDKKWSAYTAYVFYQNGRFFLVGTNGEFSTSPDGLTWTRRADLPGAVHQHAYGGGRFLAASTNANNVYISTDGITWTSQYLGSIKNLYGLSYGAGKFLWAVYDTATVEYSLDGTSWISTPIPITINNSTHIAYGNGKFVLIVSGQSTYCTSPDGIVWTTHTLPVVSTLAMTFTNGRFYLASSGINGYASDDGITWERLALPEEELWTEIAGDGTRVVFSAITSSIAAWAVTNTAPSVPSNIVIPSTIEGGRTAEIRWGSSTDADGNLSGYKLERSVNGGAWTQIYQGTALAYTDTITFGWADVTYRVKSFDLMGLESGYVTSQKRTVINNRAPTISGTNGSIGSFSAAWTAQTYTVNDADGDAVTVVETLDGVFWRGYTATNGATNTLTFTSAEWMQILNGTHTIRITATDAKGATAERVWTFTKVQNTVSLHLKTPLRADAMPLRCIINVLGVFPIGSTLKVEVCNNGNDAAPTWEDITAKVQTHQKHYFANTKKTATAWAVNVRVTLTRGSATGVCYIESVSGNFA